MKPFHSSHLPRTPRRSRERIHRYFLLFGLQKLYSFPSLSLPLSSLDTGHNLLNGLDFPQHRKISCFREVCFCLTTWPSTENDNTDGAGSWEIQGKKTLFSITGHLFAIALSFIHTRRASIKNICYFWLVRFSLNFPPIAQILRSHECANCLKINV